jgi:glutathione S-transferase
MTLALYHAVPSRGSIARWMLEEVGEPYEIRLLDLAQEENRQPPYLKINPMGKVPALEHDGAVITEAAAICCYLADAFPKAKLNIPLGDTRRGPYLKWLFFGPSCFEPAMTDKLMQRPAVPRGTAGWGDYATVLNVLSDALKQGPYLFGEHFTAADVIIGSGLRWGMLFKAVPDTPEFAAYVQRLNERPAMQRATRKDEELKKPG